MATFKMTDIKGVNIGDIVFKVMTEEDEKS